MLDLPSQRWRSYAACNGHTHLLTETYRVNRPMKGNLATIARAKTICNTCPVIDNCRNWALEGWDDPVSHHIAGGLTPHERHTIRRNRPTTTGVPQID